MRSPRDSKRATHEGRKHLEIIPNERGLTFAFVIVFSIETRGKNVAYELVERRLGREKKKREKKTEKEKETEKKHTDCEVYSSRRVVKVRRVVFMKVKSFPAVGRRPSLPAVRSLHLPRNVP